MVPLKLLSNEGRSLNSAPYPDGSADEPGWMMGCFELLSDLIMMRYLLSFSNGDMKVNERKNWMKKKMTKHVKMSLLLVLKNRSARCAASRVYRAGFS